MKTYLSIVALLFVSSIALAQNITKPADTAKKQTSPNPNARISMNVTVPKQTQGSTFGEKVSSGLHAAAGALAQGASVVQNPLHEANGNSGANPLYDPKAKAAVPVGPIKGVIVKGSKN